MPAICVTESKYISPIVLNNNHSVYLPSAIVMAGITWLSLVKEVPAPLMGDIPLADKWGHMLAYLAFALCLAVDSYRVRVSPRVLYMVSLVLPVAYGGFMEWMQLLCPPRSCELLDWVADCIGTLAGVGLFGIFHVIQIRRKANKNIEEL